MVRSITSRSALHPALTLELGSYPDCMSGVSGWRTHTGCVAWRHQAAWEAAGHVGLSSKRLQGRETAGDPDLSPEPVAHLPQHRLVPLLAACAEAWGRPPLLNHTLRSVSQHAGGVQLQLHNPQVAWCCGPVGALMCQRAVW